MGYSNSLPENLLMCRYSIQKENKTKLFFSFICIQETPETSNAIAAPLWEWLWKTYTIFFSQFDKKKEVEKRNVYIPPPTARSKVGGLGHSDQISC